MMGTFILYLFGIFICFVIGLYIAWDDDIVPALPPFAISFMLLIILIFEIIPKMG